MLRVGLLDDLLNAEAHQSGATVSECQKLQPRVLKCLKVAAAVVALMVALIKSPNTPSLSVGLIALIDLIAKIYGLVTRLG